MQKRLVCILLAMLMLMSMKVVVSADEYEDLRKQMMESFYQEKMLAIGEYGLTMEEVQAVYDGLYHSGKLPWFADEDCDYVYDQNQKVARFRPKVLNPKLYDRDLYEQKIAELIGETCLPEMSDWQKAISIHDAIVWHTVYDETLMKNTGYDSLINGSTVCYGYAMLYMDIMNRLDIPCQIVICENTGDGYGHAWNLIWLDGAWYHVDLTWDDPMPDIYGFVSHDHFLKTDEEFKNAKQPHNFEWEALEEVSQTSYEADDYLDEKYTGLCFVDANTVVYRKEKNNTNRIVSRNLETGDETTLYRFDRNDLNLGHGSYLYPTFGLCQWNGRIYFNRENMVLSMLPDGSDVQEVYKRKTDDRYIIGCYVDDGMLYLSLANHALEMKTQEVELEGVEYHAHSYHRKTVPSSCHGEGYYEQICDCGIAYNRVTIPQLEHKMLKEVVKQPTQQETGQLRHYCFMCGYEEVETLPILPEPIEEIPVEEEVHPLLQWLRQLFAH